MDITSSPTSSLCGSGWRTTCASAASRPELGKRLRDEWQAARQQERTAQTYEAWRDDMLAQAAVMWHWLSYVRYFGNSFRAFSDSIARRSVPLNTPASPCAWSNSGSARPPELDSG